MTFFCAFQHVIKHSTKRNLSIFLSICSWTIRIINEWHCEKSIFVRIWLYISIDLLQVMLCIWNSMFFIVCRFAKIVLKFLCIYWYFFCVFLLFMYVYKSEQTFHLITQSKYDWTNYNKWNLLCSMKLLSLVSLCWKGKMPHVDKIWLIRKLKGLSLILWIMF